MRTPSMIALMQLTFSLIYCLLFWQLPAGLDPTWPIDPTQALTIDHQHCTTHDYSDINPNGTPNSDIMTTAMASEMPQTVIPASPTMTDTTLTSDSSPKHYISNTSTSSDSTIQPESPTSSVSHRTYIYPLPYPLPLQYLPYTPSLPSHNPLDLPTTPTEPTSTLVLTTPNRVFVDTRFLLSLDKTAPPLPNPGPMASLDWAFAGVSSSTQVRDETAHATYSTSKGSWSHWVDSRFPPLSGFEAPADEGIVYEMPDGSAVECGSARGKDGTMHGHEECWVEEGCKAVRGERVCVVLRTWDEVRGIRGVVVRVGRWVQGVLMVKDRTVVERWAWGEDEEGNGKDLSDGDDGDKDWKRVARVGDLFLPCAVAMRSEVLKKGAKALHGDVEWTVEDVWVW